MAKETIIKMKRELTIWDNIFANDLSDTALISKIYKELILLNTMKTKIKNFFKIQLKMGKETSPRGHIDDQ